MNGLANATLRNKSSDFSSYAKPTGKQVTVPFRSGVFRSVSTKSEAKQSSESSLTVTIHGVSPALWKSSTNVCRTLPKKPFCCVQKTSFPSPSTSSEILLANALSTSSSSAIIQEKSVSVCCLTDGKVHFMKPTKRDSSQSLRRNNSSPGCAQPASGPSGRIAKRVMRTIRGRAPQERW